MFLTLRGEPEKPKIKFLTQTIPTRRPSSAACYFCRFKKVKCSNEKPQCQRCVTANVACQYPDPKKGARGKPKASKDISTSESNDVQNGSDGPPDPAASTAAQPPDRKDEGGQMGSDASAVEDRPPSDQEDAAGWSNGLDEMLSLDQFAFCDTPSSFLGGWASSPMMIGTSLSDTLLPASWPGQGLDTSSLDHSTSSSSVSALTSCHDVDCKCTSHILERLEQMLAWREYGSLLEILSAIRDVVRHFSALSQCPNSLVSSKSMLMLLILAEKLVDQFGELLCSNKKLSTLDQLSNLQYGEYTTETSEECSIVYLGLLRLHLGSFRSVLARILVDARARTWTGIAATLESLISQVEKLEDGIGDGSSRSITDGSEQDGLPQLMDVDSTAVSTRKGNRIDEI